MKTAAEILERAAAELAVGRAWRAKEILAGNIASGTTEPAVLEQYGRLLDSLGDRVEAGKYFYLSGVRKPEYEHPIALFLQRHAKLDGPGLVSRLPNAVRRTPFHELPKPVQEDLDRRGVRHAAFGIPRERRPPPNRTWTDRVLMVLALVVMLFFLASLAVGGWQVTEWVWGIFG